MTICAGHSGFGSGANSSKSGSSSFGSKSGLQSVLGSRQTGGEWSNGEFHLSYLVAKHLLLFANLSISDPSTHLAQPNAT